MYRIYLMKSGTNIYIQHTFTAFNLNVDNKKKWNKKKQKLIWKICHIFSPAHTETDTHYTDTENHFQLHLYTNL